jgi:NitT/TauT family transport system substrate-binding protein
MRIRASGAVLALAVALLSACGTGGGTSTTSSGPTKISVAYSNVSVDFLAPWVAKESGIFLKNGLDVDLQLISGGSRTMAALLSGEMQVTQQGGAEALSASAGGADVMVLGTLAPVYPYKFEVSASITGPNDLKGKKVGISNVGGSADIATRVTLSKMGLDPAKDVQIVPVESHANRTAALLTGQILGAVDDPPDSVDLERHGLHSIFDLAQQKLPAANTVIAVRSSWLSGHRDVAQHYVDSIVQAIAQAKKDKASTVVVMKKYFKSDDTEAMNIAYDFFMNQVTPSLPYPMAGQFQDSQRYLGQQNQRVRDFSISKLIDDSFMKSSANRGLDK